MVAVVSAATQVEDAAGEALEFECRRFGATSSERRHLISWLQERGVTEVVMESTAQYWKPVWLDLEPHFPKLHLAQAQSNRAPKGRKNDFRDTKRLGRRHLAGELMLSFVPDAEQRTWRTLTRSKQQLVRDRVRLQNQLEALLEEMRIKLSGVISDLLGKSGRRILTRLWEGETDPVKLAALGDERLKSSPEELADALHGAPTPTHLAVLGLFMKRVELLDEQIEALDKLVARELDQHQQAVIRLAEIPGLGVDSSQQIIAEVGPTAETFGTAGQFCSWGGFCPGLNVSAEENKSSQSAKGNGYLRRILTQAAHAAVKKKGSHFQSVFRRLLPRLGYKGAIWAIAHRLARVVWKVLHDGVRYIEQGSDANPKTKRLRANKLVRSLRKLGYTVKLTPMTHEPVAEGQAG